jgi:hypothetical protein
MNKTSFIKSNFAIYILWIVSFIVLVVLSINIFVVFTTMAGSDKVCVHASAYSNSYHDTLRPIDENISTSLPYEKYKRLKDSINNVRYHKNGANCNAVFSPFGGAMSLQFARNKDVVHKRVFDISLIGTATSYFYVMKGWKMKMNENSLPGDNTYYVENGVPYLRKYVLLSTKGTNSNWDMKEYKLNYYYYKDDKTILIPISNNAYNFAEFTSVLIMIIFVTVYFGCTLMAFKILYNISKGKVFIDGNIKMLRQASFITILTPLSLILTNLSQRLIFHNYLDDNIIMDMEVFKSYGQLLLYGLAVSVLYSVFMRGFNIQQENDLVV